MRVDVRAVRADDARVLRGDIDGARLGYALTCDANDANLDDLARIADVFTIGGTKVGAMFGEDAEPRTRRLQQRDERRHLIVGRGPACADAQHHMPHLIQRFRAERELARRALRRLRDDRHEPARHAWPGCCASTITRRRSM